LLEIGRSFGKEHVSIQFMLAAGLLRLRGAR